MKRTAMAWALSILGATLDGGCSATRDADSSASTSASKAREASGATDERPQDLMLLSDQQLADRIAEQWNRLRELTDRSLDRALNYQGTDLAQDAAYCRLQSDIAAHERRLTQLQDEQRRREKAQRVEPKPHPAG